MNNLIIILLTIISIIIGIVFIKIILLNIFSIKRKIISTASLDNQNQLNIETTKNNSYILSSATVISYDEKVNNSNEKANIEIEKEYIRNYFRILTDAVSKCEKSITVLDYISHGQGLNDRISQLNNDIYLEIINGYKTYYKFIEDKIIEKKITYSRIFQFPSETRPIAGENSIERTLLTNMFTETFAHMKRLYEDYNDRINENVITYILPNQIRPFSILFIDEKTMIFEIDIYTKSGIAKPDTLIILDQNNENNRVTFWLEQINKIIKKQNNRYDFKIALRYYQDIITAIDNNIKEKKINT